MEKAKRNFIDKCLSVFDEHKLFSADGFAAALFNAGAEFKAQSLTHSEEGLTHSDWWDYENDKRVANPPVGVNLLFDDSGVMKESVILHIGKEKILATIAGGSDTEYCMSVASLDFYYPPDHATLKAEMERKALIEQAKSACFAPNSTPTITTIECLIAAGWRPKVEKSQ